VSEPRCIRADRCADASTVDGVRVGAAVNVDHGLCVADEQHVQRAIETLPRDYVRLHLHLGRATAGSAEFATGTKELPIPLRGEVEALMSEIVDTASTWAECVAAVSGIGVDTAADQDSRPGALLDRSVRLLVPRLPVLLALRDIEILEWVPGYAWEAPTKCLGGHWSPEGGVCTEVHTRTLWRDGYREAVTRDGVDGALALLALHHRARKFLAVDRKTFRLPEPCPACRVAALEHADGADVVDCAACGARLTWADYRRRTDPLAGLEEAS
jgi:hypothetical protein